MEKLLQTNLWIILSLICFPLFIAAQNTELSQTIRGRVLDKDTRQPLIGATIRVLDLETIIASVTDLDGLFELTEVPVGRRRLECQYLGYGTYVSDNLIVNSAKELDLTIELLESSVKMDAVMVYGRQMGHEPLNELAMVSARSFSAEETQRYAASANDPSRMAVGFPGVRPARDNRSDIIVRGNANFGLLWRLEGVDILNPNHFARKGSSGGGITIFSVGMLNNSDFFTSAFPADYGNAFSGVFDMKFRNGNKQQKEHTFRAGMLGLDIATEGPIKKGKSSYLVNYRYSTLGILNAMDIRLVDERESNNFQDFSFKIHSRSDDNKHSFSFWGIGGLSDEEFSAVDGVENWQSYNDYYTRDFTTDMGAVGFNYTYLINDKAYLSSNLAVMGQKILFRNDTLTTEMRPTLINDEDYRRSRVTLNTFYSHKLSKKVSFRGGVVGTRIGYDLNRQYLIDNTYQTFLNEKGGTAQAQVYGTLRWKPDAHWTLNLGIHSLYFALNNTHSLEPRLGIRFQPKPATSISLAYGLHSRILPIGSYFTEINTGTGASTRPNEELDLLKTHHLVLAVEQKLGKQFRLLVETYYQSLYDVPVSADPNSTFSLINMIDGYARRPLVSEGTGRNIGVDVLLEKMFSNGSFFISSASFLKSTYVPLNGQRYSSNFDIGTSFNFMGGKEWEVGTGKTLQTSLRVLYSGGQRLTPILSAERDPYEPESPILDESKAFTEQVSDYFRPDIRVAYRRDKVKTAWTLALDVQNVIARKNIDGLTRDFDPDRGGWVYRSQSSLVPILSYQLDF